MKIRNLFFNKKKNYLDPFIIQEGKFKYSKLERGYRLNWIEQIFNKDNYDKNIIGRNFNIGNLSKITLVLILFLLIILFRVAWLQIIKGDYYYELAEGNRIRIDRIEAKRGVIYDREMQPLVRNIANFIVYFIPADLPKNKLEKSYIIKEVGQTLKINEDEINKNLTKVTLGSLESYRPLFIADNISYDEAMQLNLKSKLPGVFILESTRRQYNLCDNENILDCTSTLPHILGYVGKINKEELNKFGEYYLPIDYIGKIGIENFWENELRGINGKKQIEVDALGKEKKIINYQLGEDGHNLVLSIDISLQKKLEEEVKKNLDKLKLNKACAIIMDPNNGEILAYVNFPSFNNNLFAKGISEAEYTKLIEDPGQPLFNRCISGEYASGSTIKPIIAAAALEEKIINLNTTFNSSGGIKINQWYFPDWKDGGHGLTNVTKAIAESVNTFFYYIGGGYDNFLGLEVERISKYARLFGLGNQTGVDLAEEKEGFLPSLEWKEKVKGEPWYIGDTYHLAIGQGDILVTPLQVANYTSVFANGSNLYRPHFVRQVLDSNDKILGYIDNKPIRSNFISRENINIVRQGMRQAVTSGSARGLLSLPVTAAGKTGTAEWSSKKQPHAWFTGFAPYDNPEIVITVLIEEGGEGSATAIPIAQEVMRWYFTRNNTKNR